MKLFYLLIFQVKNKHLFLTFFFLTYVNETIYPFRLRSITMDYKIGIYAEGLTTPRPKRILEFWALFILIIKQKPSLFITAPSQIILFNCSRNNFLGNYPMKNILSLIFSGLKQIKGKGRKMQVNEK